jgi:hypothetical protein
LPASWSRCLQWRGASITNDIDCFNPCLLSAEIPLDAPTLHWGIRPQEDRESIAAMMATGDGTLSLDPPEGYFGPVNKEIRKKVHQLFLYIVRFFLEFSRVFYGNYRNEKENINKYVLYIHRLFWHFSPVNRIL